MPGGVNSPVRAFKSVRSTPLFIREGKGSHITDVDGNEYIDYIGSWGPLILGHCHPEVMAAIEEALQHRRVRGRDPRERRDELRRQHARAVLYIFPPPARRARILACDHPGRPGRVPSLVLDR